MMLKEVIIRNYIRRILNESDEKEKTKMVDLTLGDYTDRIPVSLVDKIKKIIRELIELESSSDDLVSDIVNGSNVDERKKDALSALLSAISNKFGKDALTKISQDFPFFEAEGKEEYSFKNKADVMNVIEIKGYGIGAGEVATALLWNAKVNNDPPPKDDSVVKDNNAVKSEKVSSVKSYDLIVDGAHADVKDIRSGPARFGGPISKRIKSEINDFINSEENVLNLTLDDLIGQAAIANRVIKAIDSGLISANDALAAIKTFIKECNDISRKKIAEDYPGGIFIVTKDKILKLAPGHFSFFRITQERISMSVSETEKDIMGIAYDKVVGIVKLAISSTPVT